MPSPRVFTLEFAVRDYELDAYQVVNNAVYLGYLEHTRHAFLRSMGVEPLAYQERGEALALAEIHCRYRRPLRGNMCVRSRLRVDALSGARLCLDQRLEALPRGELVLEAKTVAVFLDSAGRPRRLQPILGKCLAPWLEPPQKISP